MTDYDRSRCGLPSQGTCVSSFRTNSSWVASKRLTAEDTTSTLLEARAWPCSSYPTSSFTESTFTTWSPRVRRWYEAATCAWDNGGVQMGMPSTFSGHTMFGWTIVTLQMGRMGLLMSSRAPRPSRFPTITSPSMTRYKMCHIGIIIQTSVLM